MSTASNCFRTMCWRDWKWASSPLLPQILEPKTGSSKQKWRRIQLLWPLIRFVFVNYQNQYWFEKLKAPISGSELGWPPCEHLSCCRPCWVVGWIAGETRKLTREKIKSPFSRLHMTQAKESLWKIIFLWASPLLTSFSTQMLTTDPYLGHRSTKRWRI